jgi:hypothetical protein
MVSRTNLVVATISFLAGLAVYDIFLVDLYLASKTVPTKTETICPSESTFTNVWNDWSYNYINENPYNSVDEQMNDWNTLMVQNNCGDEWFDPLADLIEQQAASGTPVYWEHDTN